MKLKVSLLIFICLSASFFLTGCYNSRGVESKAYAVALGIDITENHNLKLTLQLAILEEGSGKKSSSSSSDKTTLISADCSTIDSGISLINSYISKQINLSHCKAVIISEEYATQGVSDVVYTLMNNIELRPDCNIIISKCNAYDFLENSTPIFEDNPAQYFELNFNSSEYTGFLDNLYLSDFYYNFLSSTCEPSAILAGISSTETQMQSDDSTSQLDNNYYAGTTPITSENSVESMGLAVFKEDKLIGELNNMETLCHLIVTNKLEYATINIINPFDENTTISFYITTSKDTKNTVELVRGLPYIECELWITGNIPTIYESIDLSDEKYLEILNDALSSYLRTNLLSYLYKTSRNFKSDIADFGSYLLPNYLTMQDWEASDWLNNYQNSTFNVIVHSDIQGGHLYNKL